ncbi:MAG: hypothetical protein KY476_01535 [Planctomycetes bacterium]|nr:hypothetical protein [Planctomycetota bacterium]
MKLSPEEERFLRRWMHDEVHYDDGQGPAKRLQVEHGAIPAELAILIAAAIPDPATQRAIADRTPDEDVSWPWTTRDLRQRIDEARAALRRAGRG